MVLNGLWTSPNRSQRWLESEPVCTWVEISSWWRFMLSSTLFGILPDTALHPSNHCKLMEEGEAIMIRMIAEARGPTFTAVEDWRAAPIYKSSPSFPCVIYPHNLWCITGLSHFKSHLLSLYWSFARKLLCGHRATGCTSQRNISTTRSTHVVWHVAHCYWGHGWKRFVGKYRNTIDTMRTRLEFPEDEEQLYWKKFVCAVTFTNAAIFDHSTSNLFGTSRRPHVLQILSAVGKQPLKKPNSPVGPVRESRLLLPRLCLPGCTIAFRYRKEFAKRQGKSHCQNLLGYHTHRVGETSLLIRFESDWAQDLHGRTDLAPIAWSNTDWSIDRLPAATRKEIQNQKHWSFLPTDIRRETTVSPCFEPF